MCNTLSYFKEKRYINIYYYSIVRLDSTMFKMVDSKSWLGSDVLSILDHMQCHSCSVKLGTRIT